MNTNIKSLLAKLDYYFDLYLVKKAPSLPENVKEIIVKYSPYITLIIIIFSLPAILLALGLGAVLAPFAFMNGVGYGVSFSLGTIVLLVSLVLDSLALPGLFARKLSGWQYLYYGALVNAVYSLVTFNLGNLIIGTAISMYFLFQVKNLYK